MPVFYFSLRSPYSWLAYHDLLDGYPGLADELEWVPYFDPDPATLADLEREGGRYLYTPMSKAKSLYLLQDVKRLSAARGLTPVWRIDDNPVWEVPHLAYFAAERHGRAMDFVALAYRARWEEGRDICDPRVIAELGDQLGLSGEELAAASEDPKLRAAGVEALLRVHEAGAFGVPFFTHGRSRFWGVDRLAEFVTAVEGAPIRPIPSRGTLLTGEDHAGGCG